MLGVPVESHIDIEDSEAILRAIRLTPSDQPIDLILHTPGGLVLAAKTGGLVQAVDDGVTGILVRSGDAQEWADGLTEVASWNTLKRKNFLEASMARCRAFYSWPRVAEATVAAYSR